MGQHKYNPTAQKAKAGELSPKPMPLSISDYKRRTSRLVADATGLTALREFVPSMGITSYY